MERLHNLKAYQSGYKLCLLTYRLTGTFPSNEQFAMVSQMRRAGYSVIANIAEGTRKKSGAEKCRYYETAIASLEELKCFTELASDLKYLDADQKRDVTERAVVTAKMLYGLSRSIRKAPKKPVPA